VSWSTPLNAVSHTSGLTLQKIKKNKRLPELLWCNVPQPWQGIRLDSNREASILSGLDAGRRLRILSTLVDCVEHPGAREAA
jgi:hypothetical protein